jgi:sigma-E factor negative regulatory protein RseB
VEQLPEGFVKVLHNRFAESAGRHPTEHLVFADGLATISVFLEKLDGAPALLQGVSQLGSMNAFGKAAHGYQILVVGEVPAVTVQRIAAAIQYDPAPLKAAPP